MGEYLRHRRAGVNSALSSMAPIRSGLVAAMGLLVPAALDSSLAVSAAEGNTSLNLAGISQYSAHEQVTSLSQFSDVNPRDWAY